MKEQAEDLKNVLEEKFGNGVQFSYVDVQSEEMKGYPGIQKALGNVRLPLTVLNDELDSRGLSMDMIEKAIGELLA